VNTHPNFPDSDEGRAWDWLLAVAAGTTPPDPLPDANSAAARALIELFLPVAVPRDCAIGQLGQSLDGRIATESGHSHYVTGPDDIRRLHRLRALVDAVVVGAGTATDDNPRLSVREVKGENPVRVVLDPKGRVPHTLNLFTDGASPTLLLRAEGVGSAAPEGCELLTLSTDAHQGSSGFDPHQVLALLRARGLRRILIEGGGVTVSRFLQAGALDRLHVTVAPLLIGSGRPALTLETIQTLDQALRPRCRHFPLGNDVLFDLDLRSPAE